MPRARRRALSTRHCGCPADFLPFSLWISGRALLYTACKPQMRALAGAQVAASRPPGLGNALQVPLRSVAIPGSRQVGRMGGGGHGGGWLAGRRRQRGQACVAARSAVHPAPGQPRASSDDPAPLQARRQWCRAVAAPPATATTPPAPQVAEAPAAPAAAEAVAVAAWGGSWAKAWWAVGAVKDFDASRPQPFQLLGQQLVIWRAADGTWGCLQDR